MIGEVDDVAAVYDVLDLAVVAGPVTCAKVVELEAVVGRREGAVEKERREMSGLFLFVMSNFQSTITTIVEQ